MNGLKKPRQPRPLNYNTFGTAVLNATRLTGAEIEEVLRPTVACARALREGVASSLQFEILQSCVHIAEAIEKGGIVRGLQAHFDAAQTALTAIRQRAGRSGAWQPTALHYHELDAINTTIELHEFQLKHLSAGELQRIIRRLTAQTVGQGGEMRRLSATEWKAIMGERETA